MKQSIHFIIIGFLLIAVGVIADAWLGARGDSAKLAATLATQKSAITEAITQQHDRDKLLASAVAAIAAEKRRVQTAREAAKALPLDLPELPQPIPDLPPNANVTTAESDKNGEVPPLPIPSADLKPLYDHLEDCRVCSIERSTAQQNLTDQQARNIALIKERDAAVAASKGGTIWTRIRRCAKWLSIGMAIGASAAALSHRAL